MKFPSWPEPAGHRDVNLGLSRVNELLGRLGNPHKHLPPTIHIAGTNGKGSTQAFLRAIFEDADLKVHSYVSPHLVRFNERIVLANKEIEDDFLNEILAECKKAAQADPQINVTFFEGITVAAVGAVGGDSPSSFIVFVSFSSPLVNVRNNTFPMSFM